MIRKVSLPARNVHHQSQGVGCILLTSVHQGSSNLEILDTNYSLISRKFQRKSGLGRDSQSRDEKSKESSGRREHFLN
jgi:hypothetical protein